MLLEVLLLYYLPGTAEGGVAHDDCLGREGDAGPGAEVERGHQAGEAAHQVNNSAAGIVHSTQLVQPAFRRPASYHSQRFGGNAFRQPFSRN